MEAGGHIPQRSCVACRRRGEKDSFIRLARTETREIVIDESGRKQGRGAYICRSAECLEKARKKKAFARALMVDEGKVPYEALFSAVEHWDPVTG